MHFCLYFCATNWSMGAEPRVSAEIFHLTFSGFIESLSGDAVSTCWLWLRELGLITDRAHISAEVVLLAD